MSRRDRALREGVYLQIHKQGGSRALSVTQVVPDGWHIVKVTGKLEDEKHLTLNLEVITHAKATEADGTSSTEAEKVSQPKPPRARKSRRLQRLSD